MALSIIWGLAIVLPGLFFHARLFFENDHNVEVNQATHPVAYLLSISVGTLIAHISASVLLVINHYYVVMTDWPRLSVNPNIYEIIVSGRNPSEILVMLAWFIALCLISYLAAKIILRYEKVKKLVLSLKYGVFSQWYQDTADENTFWLVHIMTKTDRITNSYRQNLSYYGELAKLVRSGNRIEAVHLRNASPFFVKMTAGEFETDKLSSFIGPAKTGSRLPYICIASEQILNISFSIFKPSEKQLVKFKALRAQRLLDRRNQT